MKEQGSCFEIIDGEGPFGVSALNEGGGEEGWSLKLPDSGREILGKQEPDTPASLEQGVAETIVSSHAWYQLLDQCGGLCHRIEQSYEAPK